MSNQAKSPTKSKTIWFNVLTLLSVAVTAVADHSIITEHPVLSAGAAVLVSLVNVGLRLVTKKPIA